MRIDRLSPRARLGLPAVLLTAALLAGCGSDDDDDPGPTAPGGEDPADWVALAASHDTYLDEDRGNTNYGQSGVLRTGPEQHALLQFDLQALPADAVVTGMRLHLTRTAEDAAATAASVRIFWLPADGWEEDTATAEDGPDLGGEALGDLSLDALAAGQRHTATFTSSPALEKTFHEQLYGNRVLGVRLASNQMVTILSGENPDASLRPRLEVTVADGTRVFLPASEDASVGLSDPGQNFADLEALQVDRDFWHTFVKFDLTALPTDATVQLARLRMLANDGFAYGGDGRVYTRLVADDTWTAATITADTAPQVVGEHLGHWWLWYDGTDRDAWGVNGSVRLRPAVAAEGAGDGTLSLRLDSPGYRTEYYRTSDPDESKRPTLEIVYTR